MKTSLRHKLEQVVDRYEEITAMLADPTVQGDQNQFRALGQEYAQLGPVVTCYRDFKSAEADLQTADEMLLGHEYGILDAGEGVVENHRQPGLRGVANRGIR